jgi:hypothetical protein
MRKLVEERAALVRCLCGTASTRSANWRMPQSRPQHVADPPLPKDGKALAAAIT